ncbi:MAG TPA: thrombospondin type 3 repeat-containing protein [Kofleriaceae bacterium]
MLRGVIAVALCVGCYSPAFGPGTPCETDCPGDLVCIDRVCREPGYVPDPDGGMPMQDGDGDVTIDAPDAAPGDADGDGVDNALDNCPERANADQHNEDSDAPGDVCDPCPHLTGGAIDGDGDGVGDACDPQPTIAKQMIRFFDPFTTDMTGWMHESGAGRVGETLRISGADLSSYLMLTTGEARIAMAGTIAAIMSPAGEHQLSLIIGKNQTGNIYHYTEFYDSGGSDGEISITKANNGTYTNLGGTSYSGTLPLGAWSMRVDQSVSSQRMGFEAKLGGIAYGPYQGSTAQAPALVAAPRLEVYVANADIRLDYFIVIETMP